MSRRDSLQERLSPILRDYCAWAVLPLQGNAKPRVIWGRKADGTSSSTLTLESGGGGAEGRGGQATFHLRGLCRTCDPCTATLLAAEAAALSADRTPELAATVAEHRDERLPAHELAA